jgi:hypothetical protein
MPHYDADDDDDDEEELLSFDDRRRQWEEDDNQVRCANCGKWIPAVTSKCPLCDINFRGEAQDFEYEPDDANQSRGLPLWVILTAVVLLLLMVLGVVCVG